MYGLQPRATGLRAATPALSIPALWTSDLASQVMNSKQRPRRLAVMGSDGKEYVFLLKGHEDLRQDERVMQLFGLVNTLLAVDASCARLDLGVHRL